MFQIQPYTVTFHHFPFQPKKPSLTVHFTTKRFQDNEPEFVVYNLQQTEGWYVINAVAWHLSNNQIKLNERFTIQGYTGGTVFMLEELTKEQEVNLFLSDNLPAPLPTGKRIQILWSDPQGRFPGDPDGSDILPDTQPRLSKMQS